MSQPIAAEPVPLAVDSDDVIRVGGTRITLETVVDAFNTGATPEEIAQDFPSLRLDDAYAVITYYLRHRDEVEEYIGRRRAEALSIRAEVEEARPQTDLRQRLLDRLGR